MDYEKKYNEALERAKDCYVNKRFSELEDTPKEICEYIFPELRESEDERIRKEIISIVKAYRENCIDEGTHRFDDCLSWLEKQKEQKPAEKQDYSDLCTVGRGCFQNGNNHNDLERAIHRGFLAAGVENVPVGIIKETAKECLAQMKPAEWSEKRKKELGDYLLNMIKLVNTGAEKLRYTNDELEKYVEKCVQDVIDLCPISQQTKQEWSEEDEEMLEEIINHIDTTSVQRIPARPGSAIGKSWIKFLKSIRPQPKQEWSEEDEDMLNCCISSIEEAKENRYAYKETDGDTSYDHEIDWLKSLRPSWRPSEEQMEALLWCTAHLGGADHRVLAELYEHLKKL